MHQRLFALLFVLVIVAPLPSRAENPSLETRFDQTIKPFLAKYCTSCHGPEKQESKLNLSTFKSVSTIIHAYPTWEGILERVEPDEMPPRKAKTHPTAQERQLFVAWIKELFDREATKNAGDPGTVLARRLSNAEYDNTICDLTGIDLRPAKEFPVDPANEAGFANSGESLTMSPALLKKYLEAARKIADHVVLKPDGAIDFSPDPAVTDTDRDKYCVQRIIKFYDNYKIDYSNCFSGLIRDESDKTRDMHYLRIRGIADYTHTSVGYLRQIRDILEGEPRTGPLGELQDHWKRRPKHKSADGPSIRAWCDDMRDHLLVLRKPLLPTIPALNVKGMSRGSQPLVIWRNEQIAHSHQLPPSEEKLKELAKNAGPDVKPEILKRDVALFCELFPDVFFISDRGPYFDPKAANKGRPLTAGFHLMQGYSRDDAPLRNLILFETDKRYLNTLWDELYFITNVLERQYKDYIFFERAEPPRFAFGPEFDFARSENKDATSEPTIRRLQKVSLAKAKTNGASDVALGAIDTFFNTMATDIARVRQSRLDAEPAHIQSLHSFASRAFRRPLSPQEHTEIDQFYKSLRIDDNLSHEDAIRDSITSLLMSPYFMYRTVTSKRDTNIHKLSKYDLASRLSYFLWSSPPDDKLLKLAADGTLDHPEVLKAQTFWMIQVGLSRALAQEFFATWLDIRRFGEHNAVDRARFPQFTNELRSAMYEEPITFFLEIAHSNRPVRDFLYANDTFVNPVLAKHYGIPVPDKTNPDTWLHILNADTYGRGGLLPMAVFLTSNSPGLRTSPVKRGYWVVKRVLGTPIPPPPAVVPELPKDEATPGDLSLAQLLVRHRADNACAGCHQKFDSVGLVFEGYGPIGERRTHDLGGRLVDPRATLPDGSDRTGLPGLKQYLTEARSHDFIDTFLRKLFAYALGRSLILSDEPTIKEMHARLAPDGYRFIDIVQFIVTTKQFMNARDADATESEIAK